MALMLCPVGKSAGSAAPITRQPDVAGGHCNTLQCSLVTAVLALVAERGTCSVTFISTDELPITDGHTIMTSCAQNRISLEQLVDFVFTTGLEQAQGCDGELTDQSRGHRVKDESVDCRQVNKRVQSGIVAEAAGARNGFPTAEAGHFSVKIDSQSSQPGFACDLFDCIPGRVVG